MFACFTGNYRRTEQLANQGLALCDAAGFDIGAAYGLRFLGEARLAVGDAAGAEEFLRRALTVAERFGVASVLGDTWNLLAEAARFQGRLADAERSALRALRFGHEAGDPLLVSYILNTLAEVVRDAGDYVRARRMLRVTLRTHHRMDAVRALAEDFEALAATHSLDGGAADVFTLVAAARRLRAEVGMPITPIAERALTDALRPALARTTAEDRARAEARGWNTAIDSTVALALRLTQATGQPLSR
jgi:tetratricopeptide (TPR) repeat protein